MNIVGTRLNRKEFSDYVKNKEFGYKPANRLFIHHTWRPTKEDWSGMNTLMGIKRYYEGKGWTTGPHLFIADDGIWLFTDMRKDGTHAGPRGNHRSVGIEVVGDYDNERWSGETKTNALHAIKALQDKLKIEDGEVYFHRDVSSKTCPGKAIEKEWLFEQLRDYSLNPDDMPDIKPPSEWAAESWHWCVARGIINKESDPHAPITKQEYAVMTKRDKDSLT